MVEEYLTSSLKNLSVGMDSTNASFIDLLRIFLADKYQCRLTSIREVVQTGSNEGNHVLDLILVDLIGQSADPLTYIERIADLLPGSKIVALAGKFDDAAVLWQTGVIEGVISSSFPLERMCRILGVIASGETYLPVELYRSESLVQKKEATERLSARELSVVAQVSRGKTNQEIAEHLGIKLPTVKSNISSALKKSGTTNRAQLAIYARINGISS